MISNVLSLVPPTSVATGLRPTKRCSKCAEEKPHSEFNKRAASPDGLQSHCRDCAAKLNKEARDAGSAVYAGYIKERGHACELCEKRFPMRVYNLHHLDPALKSEKRPFRWRSWTGAPYERTRAEAEMCALLCSNCHIMEHEALDQGWSPIVQKYPLVDLSDHSTFDWRLRTKETAR